MILVERDSRVGLSLEQGIEKYCFPRKARISFAAFIGDTETPATAKTIELDVLDASHLLEHNIHVPIKVQEEDGTIHDKILYWKVWEVECAPGEGNKRMLRALLCTEKGVFLMKRTPPRFSAYKGDCSSTLFSQEWFFDCKIPGISCSPESTWKFVKV